MHREVDKDLFQLLDRVNHSLQWIVNNAMALSTASLSPLDTSDKPPSIPYINWDVIANSEIHILHKLGDYLKQHMENSTHSKLQHNGQSIYDVFERGYQCNALEASQQEGVICAQAPTYMHIYYRSDSRK